MKRLLALLAFFVVSLSCATASAFNGPVSDKPTIAVSYLRHLEQYDPRLPPQVVTIATAAITNPSTHEMTVTLDCARTFTTLTIAPRTTEHVLLDPKDTSCSVTR